MCTGDPKNPDQGFLIVDCMVVFEIELQRMPLYILASYFVFNIEYPRGLHNLFTYLEIELMGANPNKVAASIKYFITAVEQHQ